MVDFKIKIDNQKAYIYFDGNEVGELCGHSEGYFALKYDLDNSNELLNIDSFEKKDLSCISVLTEFEKFNYKVDNIPSEIQSIYFEEPFIRNPNIPELVYDEIEYDLSKNRLDVNFEMIDFFNWKNTFSIQELDDEIKRQLKKSNLNVIKRREETTFEDDSILGDLLIEVDQAKNNGILQNIDRIITELNEILYRAKQSLEDGSAFVTKFEFPSEIRTICKQYLLYFAEFLRDLGIEVTNELYDNNDGATIFKVTPHSKDDALSKIADALKAYLSLESKSDLELTTVSTYSTDLAAQQLLFNVTSLKSQLGLINATKQAHEMTIQAQNIIIEAQKEKIFNFELLLNDGSKSKKALSSKVVLWDFIEVGKFELYGIDVNLAILLRKLRRKFWKNKTQD